ncbi:MAG: EamA family transporter [Candidatus Brocadiaceae bacterium]|nr:EamA family transporter [Candidatus Brocadiaceae bacterium]
MKPQLFALMTAMAWGIGSYFEKKGLHEGNLSPQVGITIRTVSALVILAIVSFPQWKSIPEAGTRPLLYMIVGGGLLAGSIGMLCFYAAVKGAPLGKVMPIAFTSPLFGAMMAVAFGGEPLSARTGLGMLLTVGGIILLTLG